jgi:4-aminobutyrate aminotransferase
MLVLGKGLGGGVFPLAALVAREGLNVAAHTALGHYTHEKNPVACAAGLATLDVIEEEGLVEHARELGEYAKTRLDELATRHALVGEVRGLGLLLGLELVRRDRGGARACDEAERVMYGALRRGLNFKVAMGNILTLTPGLVISRAELDQAIGILEASLKDVEASLTPSLSHPMGEGAAALTPSLSHRMGEGGRRPGEGCRTEGFR